MLKDFETCYRGPLLLAEAVNDQKGFVCRVREVPPVVRGVFEYLGEHLGAVCRPVVTIIVVFVYKSPIVNWQCLSSTLEAGISMTRTCAKYFWATTED